MINSTHLFLPVQSASFLPGMETLALLGHKITLAASNTNPYVAGTILIIAAIVIVAKGILFCVEKYRAHKREQEFRMHQDRNTAALAIQEFIRTAIACKTVKIAKRERLKQKLKNAFIVTPLKFVNKNYQAVKFFGKKVLKVDVEQAGCAVANVAVGTKAISQGKFKIGAVALGTAVGNGINAFFKHIF